MPNAIRIPGAGSGGLSAVLTAPGSFNATASGNAISFTWAAAPIPALTKGVRIWGQRVSEASDAYEPATWTLLTPLATGTSYTDLTYIWDRDPVNLRIAYVAVDNTVGPYSFVNNVSVIWGPLNQLALWNQDMSNAVWVKNAGCTVTGTAGNQTVTFTTASLACNQTFPALLNGQTYTFYYRVQGTNGQTINFSVYDQDVATGPDYFHTFDGTVQDLAFTRTIATTGRRLSVGPNTYAGTARTFTFFRMGVSNGTFNQAQMIANWELTQGPGSTRQEPAKPTGPVTYNGHWLHSDNPSIPTLEIADGVITVLNARLSGKGTIIKGTSGTPSLSLTNSRTWAMHPLANSVSKGYNIDLGYPKDLTATNNSFRSGMGIRYKYGRNSATVVLVKNNVARDLDGRICTAGGGYVQSSYSNIQNKPPGAPTGNTVTNFFQAQGSFDGENAVNPPVPPQGIDVDGNEVTCRPGYGKVEDVISFIQCRGNATTPYFARNNFIYSNTPWDFVWHATSNPSNLYNYGNIKTTFNLLLTVGPAGAAISATTIPLTQGNNLVSYSIPNGTVLTFTGGKTATINGSQTGNGGSLTVQALAAALSSGDTATITGVQDGPGPYSGTAIMLGDGIRGPTNVAYAWERQTRWGRAENNTTMGPSAIQSICVGTDVEIRSGLIVNTNRMIDGTITDDNSRNGFYQVNTFSTNASTALDSASSPQLISSRYGVNNSKGYNAGVSYGSGGADNVAGYSYGVRNISTTMAFKDGMIVWADWRAEKTGLGLTVGPTS